MFVNILRTGEGGPRCCWKQGKTISYERKPASSEVLPPSHGRVGGEWVERSERRGQASYRMGFQCPLGGKA